MSKKTKKVKNKNEDLLNNSECKKCNGYGIKREYITTEISVPCPKCHGEGEVEWMSNFKKKTETFDRSDIHRFMKMNLDRFIDAMTYEAAKFGLESISFLTPNVA